MFATIFLSGCCVERVWKVAIFGQYTALSRKRRKMWHGGRHWTYVCIRSIEVSLPKEWCHHWSRMTPNPDFTGTLFHLQYLRNGIVDGTPFWLEVIFLHQALYTRVLNHIKFVTFLWPRYVLMLYEFSGRNGRERRRTSWNNKDAVADPGKRHGVHSYSAEGRFGNRSSVAAIGDETTRFKLLWLLFITQTKVIC